MSWSGPWWLAVLLAIFLVLGILYLLGVRFDLDAEMIRLGR